jgi:hypothetical protein
MAFRLVSFKGSRFGRFSSVVVGPRARSSKMHQPRLGEMIGLAIVADPFWNNFQNTLGITTVAKSDHKIIRIVAEEGTIAQTGFPGASCHFLPNFARRDQIRMRSSECNRMIVDLGCFPARSGSSRTGTLRPASTVRLSLRPHRSESSALSLREQLLQSAVKLVIHLSNSGTRQFLKTKQSKDPVCVPCFC